MGTEVSQVATLLWKDVGAGVGPHRHAHKQRRECIREATQSSGRYCSGTLGASEKIKSGFLRKCWFNSRFLCWWVINCGRLSWWDFRN